MQKYQDSGVSIDLWRQTSGQYPSFINQHVSEPTTARRFYTLIQTICRRARPDTVSKESLDKQVWNAKSKIETKDVYNVQVTFRKLFSFLTKKKPKNTFYHPIQIS